MNGSDSTQRCERCGTALTPDALKGLCPRCLLALNLAAQTEMPDDEAGPHGTQIAKPPPQPAPSPDELRPLFPQLEILECLGRGGMGAVYKARQPRLERFVALKILLPERLAGAGFTERFAREARALARLNHPAIVAVYDFGEAGGYPFLVMEYVDGLSLRQLLLRGRLAPEEALVLVPKICEALQFAHQQGIVHRDIKPENILLDQQGSVKIADFGIAKMAGKEEPGPALTQGQILGTPHYMAPEQVEQPGRVDHRADIFSLGVVFYEMLTGELPLGRFQPPSRKVQVDVRLDEVVLHALEKEPERRYQHASEIKTAVESIAATDQGPNVRTGAVVTTQKSTVRRLLQRILPVLAGLGLLSAGMLFFLRGGSESRGVDEQQGRTNGIDLRLQATNPPAALFGPVMECVLYDPDERRENESLTLRDGSVSSVLAGAEKLGGGRMRALAGSLADIYVEYDDFVSRRWALVGAGLVLADVLDRDWDTLSVAALESALRHPTRLHHITQWGASIYLLPEDLLPMTFAFRTRGNDIGLLQIIGYPKNPRGVQIRYKLVQADKPDWKRALSIFNEIEDFGHEFEAAFTTRNIPAALTGTRRLATMLTNFNQSVKGTGYEFPTTLFDDLGRIEQAVRAGDWAKVRDISATNTYRVDFQTVARKMLELARQQKAEGQPDKAAESPSKRR